MPVNDEVRAFAPATVANVNCGFDIFGFALDEPGDDVTACFQDEKKGVVISDITGDGGDLSKDPTKNTAGMAADALLKHLDESRGVAIQLHKKMPLSSGLGSSAASAVAAVVAVNALLGNPLKDEELLPFAMEGEQVASGTKHADNVAPSLLGGFVLIRSYTPLDIVPIPIPEALCCVVVRPHLEISTEEARKILKPEVPMKLLIAQCANAAGLIAGLGNGDFNLIGRSLEDRVIEPQRSSLIPGFAEVKKAACDAGALGCGISGAGPSLFALCSSMEGAQCVGGAMKKAWGDQGLDGDLYHSAINRKGAYVYET